MRPARVHHPGRVIGVCLVLPRRQRRGAHIRIGALQAVLKRMLLACSIATVPEHIALSLVAARIAVAAVLLEGDLAAEAHRVKLLVGDEQVVVVAVARRSIPGIGPDTHSPSGIVHERVVQHQVVVRRMDQQSMPVEVAMRFGKARPCEDVVAHDVIVGGPLQEQVGPPVVIEAALLDHIVEVVHVEPESRSFVVGEVQVAEGAVGGVEPLASA